MAASWITKSQVACWASGGCRLEFDRLIIPDGEAPVATKVILVHGFKVDSEGRILGRGHPKRDAVGWAIPLLWPIKLATLPLRGPRPSLKGEQVITLRLMEDVRVPCAGSAADPPDRNDARRDRGCPDRDSRGLFCLDECETKDLLHQPIERLGLAPAPACHQAVKAHQTCAGFNGNEEPRCSSLGERKRYVTPSARCPRQRRERELGEVGFEEILEIGVLRGLGVDQDQSARVRSCGDRRHSGQNQENNDRSAFRTFSGSNHGGFRSARAP